jgi:hypothetical protein
MSITISKPLIYGNLAIFGGVILLAMVMGINDFFDKRERAGYKDYTESYLEKPQNPLPHRMAVPEDAVVINGKLVIVNLNNKSIDPIFNRLPKELKPETPEQVKTVLWIKCEPQPSDLKYADGTKGIGALCELTFIDFLNKKYLWRDTVSVSPPVSKKRGDEPAPPDPGEAILWYLKGIAKNK